MLVVNNSAHFRKKMESVIQTEFRYLCLPFIAAGYVSIFIINSSCCYGIISTEEQASFFLYPVYPYINTHTHTNTHIYMYMYMQSNSLQRHDRD
jgi:hypothetical protein